MSDRLCPADVDLKEFSRLFWKSFDYRERAMLELSKVLSGRCRPASGKHKSFTVPIEYAPNKPIEVPING